MMTGTAKQGERYWLSDGMTTQDHLVAQAEVYSEEAEELLDRIGLDAGASAIDVGCGVLGVLDLLRERVGDRGRVVGLDVEPGLLELAHEAAHARGITIETVLGDVRETRLAAGSFDLVHERAVLLNLIEPERAVAEMARLARTGGFVALQEPDPASWVCDPPHPAFSILREEVIAVYPRTGRQFEIGRRTARLLREAGLADVKVRATARVTRPGDYYHTFLLTLCALMRDPLLAGGRLTPERIDGLTHELGAHLARPESITCQPLMWQAWGVKQA
jgi:ubiquinone/menaquinone biosynthesis C-methylase UbiE